MTHMITSVTWVNDKKGIELILGSLHDSDRKILAHFTVNPVNIGPKDVT